MKNIEVQIVGTEWVQTVWPKIEAFVSKAIEQGLDEYSAENVRAELACGAQTLFVALEEQNIIGCGTVKIANTHRHRIAYITSYGGKGITKPEVFGFVERWCLSQGATKIQAYAKESQMRLYKKALGFSAPCYVVEKNYA
jgi:Acetyltransferase (GNAT) family